MRESLLKHLVCPNCKGELGLTVEERDEYGIKTGTFLCPPCQAEYKILKSVGRFVPDESYATSFGQEWNIFNRVQLDSANGTTISRTRFEQLTKHKPKDLQGKLVLEGGCGMGRFLEVVSSGGAEAIGVDLSTAVDACHNNLKHRENVHIVQADLRQLPFRTDTFDFIYSVGVLMITPNTREAFLTLPPYLKEGGEICVWVYGYRWAKWIPRPYQIYGSVIKRLSTPTQLKVLRSYVRTFMPLGRIPVAGRFFRLAFPVDDLRHKKWGRDGYDNGRVYSKKLIYEWADLNSFDALTPAYTTQHSFEEVKAWFEEAGLKNVEANTIPVAISGRRS